MAKIKFRDILVKVTNIFTTDIYLINNHYIIGGDKSNKENIGYYLCSLSPEVSEVCNERFDSNKIYYFQNAKNAKDDLESNVNEVTKDNELNQVKIMLNNILDLVKKTDTWNKFNFSEEDVKRIFDDKQSIELFSDFNDIPTVTVSKTLFPLTTEKNVSDLYYNTFKYEDYVQLLISLDYPLFQLYMLYKYIDIE